MDEKKFQLPEIILLLILAVGNDVLAILGDLSLAIPIVGEVIVGSIEVINIFIWAIILFWFIMKMGFGGPAIIQIAGELVEMIGLPVRTLTVGLGIYLANHPKAAQVAVLATAGAGLAAAEGAETAAAETAGAEAATAEIAAAETRAAGSIAETETAETAAAGTAEEGLSQEKAAAPEKEIPPEALGEEKSTFEKLRELTEKVPSSSAGAEEREGEEVDINDENNEIDLRNL